MDMYIDRCANLKTHTHTRVLAHTTHSQIPLDFRGVDGVDDYYDYVMCSYVRVCVCVYDLKLAIFGLLPSLRETRLIKHIIKFRLLRTSDEHMYNNFKRSLTV